MKFATVTIAILAAVGAAWWYLYEESGLTAAERRVVENAVRARLKDPSSAQFSIVFARRGIGGRKTVCGMVNARNAMGGYTGARPFIGMLDPDTGTLTVERIAQDDAAGRAIVAKCQKA